MESLEAGTPIRIGAGSFATIYVISGGLVAFKQVSHTDNAEKPRQEYDALGNIYLQCNTDSFFAVPRALAFSNPLAKEFSTPTASRLRTARPLVTPGVMTAFQQPTYAMDRVHALPFDARRHLAKLYFPPEALHGSSILREGLHRSSSF